MTQLRTRPEIERLLDQKIQELEDASAELSAYATLMRAEREREHVGGTGTRPISIHIT